MQKEITLKLTFEKPKDAYVLRQMVEVFLKEKVETNSICEVI